MNGRLAFPIIAFAAGVVATSLVPGISQLMRRSVGLAPVVSSTSGYASPRKADPEQPADKPAMVRLTEAQTTNAHIDLVVAQGGTLTRRVAVPGTIIPQADRIARVAVKLSGTVAELRKNLGDKVAKDEVLAVLESREVADAKSDYLAARLADELQQELFTRDKTLWDSRVATEQQFLRSRNLAAQTRMKLDIARQKLFALGLDEKEIASLPQEPEASLRRQAVRAPMAGRVVERKVDLGAAVGRDNLETELFVIMDLQRVWVELTVGPADLVAVKEGLHVSIASRGAPETAEGRIVFISPLLDRDTRSARVVAEIPNPDGVWRPGSFVTAAIAIEKLPIPLALPATAIQTVAGEQVIFVRTEDGFEKRPVSLGRSDGRTFEVLSGLRVGETVAVTNTFALKAEFLKNEAED